jgi:HEAT repeat protein
VKLELFLSLLLILSSIVTCPARGQADIPATAPAPAAAPAPITAAPAATPEEETSRQLRIFREALLQGSTEDIRIEAAVELLLRNSPESWDVLVTALNAADNPQARLAVCKALIKSRGLGQTLGSRRIFLGPLMQLLVTAPADQAVTAAEALLLFDFADVEPGLTETLKNGQGTQQSRVNAVYALQIRPEPRALRSLIQLLDNTDAEVSKAAENALQEAFGIPVGTSRKVWSDILDELKQKSPDDIRRERLLRQEIKLRQMQAERDRWQKLYLASLDRQYEMADEAGRGKMTLELLASDLSAIRLWALGRVAQYQATDKDPLRDKLFALLSDESRDVRLQTAKVLNSMSALNPAQKLLDRIKIESDPEVALAMFEALGEACFFAFSRGSPIELSPEIKSETLGIAVQYLLREQTETARKAAGVIRKMLELNNLSKESVDYYLDVIYQRYRQSAGQNAVLQADLLSVMAHLCGQVLTRTQASKLYEEAFIQSITVTDNAPLRLAGFRGLVNIDPVKAFSLAKTNQLMQDDSPAVRLLVIELAGTSGTVADLEWLLNSLASNGHAEQAWTSIKSICQRQKSPFILEWVPNLERVAALGTYVREILELAEQKAIVEQATASLIGAREKLIQWYKSRNAWEQGYAYLEKIGHAAPGSPFNDTVNADILEIYLFAGDFEKMAQVVESELTKQDFIESSPVYGQLSNYLNDPSIPEEVKRAIFEKLSVIKADNRPEWKAFIKGWSPLFRVSASTELASSPQPVVAD